MEVTLALAILLGLGFALAKLGQLIRLPSVTGYICCGLLLGPSGLGLITPEMTAGRLDHFNSIALMLIAFGIGEHLEIKKLRHTAKNVFHIAALEALCAFLAVFTLSYFAARFFEIGGGQWDTKTYVAFAGLLGTIAIATAPASTLHVVRELKATGPWTTTLMQVVAVDNGLAIVTFGWAAAIAKHVLGAGDESLLIAVSLSFGEVIASLTMGVVTGVVIDTIGSKLKNRSEMLTAGLSLLLLCGEAARFFEFSPLLAGMAAGFTIVNRDQRDVRFFRSLNAFEAPIYVLFFTLAGIHLDVTALKVAGWLGLIYFLGRGLGKIYGAHLAGLWANAATEITQFLGRGLLSQAGVAIGLVFLVQADPEVRIFSSIITPTVLAGVLLAELAGPPLAKHAVLQSGDVPKADGHPAMRVDPVLPHPFSLSPEAMRLVPWTWEKLIPPKDQEGDVIFGASNMATVAGLARMSTILAHHYKAQPCAVRVLPTEISKYYTDISAETKLLFAVERAEVDSLGYKLDTEVTYNNSIPDGILSKACKGQTKGIVLGHPLHGTPKEFYKVVERVVHEAPCQVIVVRFSGILHTEKILVPIVSSADVDVLENIVCALSKVGEHRITLLRLLRPGERAEDVEKTKMKLLAWSISVGLERLVKCKVRTTEARLESIVEEAQHHDLLVMAAGKRQGIERLVFGSLPESVVEQCGKPMLIVHEPFAKSEIHLSAMA